MIRLILISLVVFCHSMPEVGAEFPESVFSVCRSVEGLQVDSEAIDRAQLELEHVLAREGMGSLSVQLDDVCDL